MKIFKKILAILGISILIFVVSFSSILIFNTDFSNPKDLREYITNKMEKAEIEGMSIIYIRDGEIQEPMNFGYSDAANKTEVNNDTIFQIASVSKTITGTAIMQLYEQGKFQLDDPINNYLSFDIVHPKYIDTPITFRMLLAHTSGIEDNTALYESLYTIGSGGGDSPIALEEFIREYMTEGGKWYDADLNFTDARPGKEFLYSNTGYGLLGYLVEVISGQTFPDYCEANIFAPLDMHATTWLFSDTEVSRLSVLYDKSNEPIPAYSFPTYPDGALKTTTEDYSHFISAILHGGEYNGNRILEASTIEEMFTAQADEGRQALTWEYSIPLSLLMVQLYNKDVVGHTGGDPGIFSIVLMNRKTQNGVILFMNKSPDFNWDVLNQYFLLEKILKEADL
jgi:CubicO group peptidase (beta-lactamase class C family)